MTPVRKARRFSAPFGKEMSSAYARSYDLTPEAADLLAAINQCDPEDLASAVLVLAALNNAISAGEGQTTGDVIAQQLALLRDANTAVDLLRELARSGLHREGDFDAG
jgi:hypothetical protein